VHGAAFAQCYLAQFMQVTYVVNVVEEARLAIVTALHDMLRDLGEVESRLASHGCVRVVTCQACRLTPKASVSEISLPMREIAL
jgi:hypothetical protein